MVGQRADEGAASTQVGAPGGVVGQSGRDAGQPRQRSPVAGAGLEAGDEDGRFVAGVAERAAGEGVLGFCEGVAAVGGDEEEPVDQGGPRVAVGDAGHHRVDAAGEVAEEVGVGDLRGRYADRVGVAAGGIGQLGGRVGGDPGLRGR